MPAMMPAPEASVPVSVRALHFFERGIGHVMMMDSRERLERGIIMAANERKSELRDAELAHKGRVRQEKGARRVARKLRMWRWRSEKLWQVLREKTGFTS